MINHNDQHTRQPDPEQTDHHPRPLDIEHLLHLAAHLGVPVMRCHGGRLEVHEAPQRDDARPVLARADAVAARPVGVPLPDFPGNAADSTDLERKLLDVKRDRHAARRSLAARRG